MHKNIKKYITGLFYLLIAYSYSMYFLLKTALNLPDNKNLFHIYSGILAIIVTILFAKNYNKIPVRARENGIILSITAILLYGCTSLLYGHINDFYWSYFLSMGVRFIPAILAGCLILKNNSIINCIEQSLLIFVSLYTIILSKVVFSAEIGVNIGDTYNAEGGLNYQTISYYSVYAFGLTMYILTYNKYPLLLKYILIFLAFMQILMAIMAGGRGALILSIVLYIYFSFKKRSLIEVVLFLFFTFCAVILVKKLLSSNPLFELGYTRIFSFFSDAEAVENDNRWIRWNLAWKAFLSNPILGNGIGSVFYEVGFYSHNILCDILCEGGIVLFLFTSSKLVQFYKKAKSLIRLDNKNEIFIVIFLCIYINLMFSGYYLSESGIWMALFYIIHKPSVAYS